MSNKYRQINLPAVIAVGRVNLKVIFALWVSLLLSACVSPEGLEDIYDPYEARNRKVHEINKALDEALLRPVAGVYTGVVPNFALIGVSNLSNFLELPASVVNNLLQLNLGDAGKNSARFVINGTVGVLGLYDAASEIGLYQENADFGQTLHTWGVSEGAYVELPVIGGSTERDTVGLVVDAMFNPTTMFLPEYWKLTGTGVKSLAMLGDRGRFGTTVDSVLYDSADSYSQSRLFYLQSRRHELGQELADEDYFDPYEDLYDE